MGGRKYHVVGTMLELLKTVRDYFRSAEALPALLDQVPVVKALTHMPRACMHACASRHACSAWRVKGMNRS